MPKQLTLRNTAHNPGLFNTATQGSDKARNYSGLRKTARHEDAV